MISKSEETFANLKFKMHNFPEARRKLVSDQGRKSINFVLEFEPLLHPSQNKDK